MRRRLTPEEEQQICAEYLRGDSANLIAERHNISRAAVYDVRKRNNLPTKIGPGKVGNVAPAASSDAMLQLVRDTLGKTIDDLRAENAELKAEIKRLQRKLERS